ncbi:hypothetical protein H5P29_00845 [Aminobacter sp. MDW-2]|nr:hypothetical protein [Aminobacter sp. MDW-2]QNH36970.1 hypothetical protein H5P29_00845 [Aminobacter sp. MDW-2]
MTKAPAEVLDYDVDFGRWLPDGDSITSAVAVVAPGTAVAVTLTEHSDTTAKTWVSGGADGQTAHITLTITTMGGRTKEVCFRLRIKECH